MDLLKKLRVNTDSPVWLINAPGEVVHIFESLDVKLKIGKQKPLSQFILFVYDSKELADFIHRLEGYIAHDTLFWYAILRKVALFG